MTSVIRSGSLLNLHIAASRALLATAVVAMMRDG
jgi:hypothetical protein